MHADRAPRAATTGNEAEDEPTGLEGFEETVSEARETTSVDKLGKQKRQGRKPSGYLLTIITTYHSTSVHS